MFLNKVKHGNLESWLPKRKKLTVLHANIFTSLGTNSIQEDAEPWALNQENFPLR
jgi:hypothetical protein